MLKFRNESHHAKCVDCARFKELIRQARAGLEKDSIVASYRNHISDMLEDREIDVRMVELSEQSCSGVCCVFFVLIIALYTQVGNLQLDNAFCSESLLRVTKPHIILIVLPSRTVAPPGDWAWA